MVTIQVPKVLPFKEVITMRPQDRQHYIEKIILDILEMNPRGVTITDIARKTSFYRDTVAKHLERLVATREAYSIMRGNAAVYYKNGQVVHATDVKDATSQDRTYTFFKLQNDDGKFIYIQEKELDEFRALTVKGGIMIDARYVMQFIKELQNFVMGVKTDE
jgi:predicted transcriptional regulator